jgi:hypothetical protein
MESSLLNHRAPLLLLFEQPAETISAALSHFVTSNPDIVRSDSMGDRLGIGSVLHQGIAFNLQVVSAIKNFNPQNWVHYDSDPAITASFLAIELGENVKGGEVIAPIIRALLSLSDRLGEALEAKAVYWRAADILSGFDYFSQAVRDYDGGGVFPVLALIHFDRNTAGLVASKGLAFLCEQEIHFALGMMPPEEGMRRVIRVAHDLATNGPITAPLELSGFEASECLTLSPDAAGRMVSFQITSKMDQ